MPNALIKLENSANATGKRLSSWKEIAAHLERAERTVKRWESERGLPVHRIPGGARGSVYAFSQELDTWLKSSPNTEALLDDEEEVQAVGAVSFLGPEIVQPAAEPAAVLVTAEDAKTTDSLPRPSVSIPIRRWKRWRIAAGVVIALIIPLAGGSLLQHAALSASSGHASPAKGRAGDTASGSHASSVSASEQAVARDLYIKGRYEWSQRNPESLNRALDYFTQSIVHDPGYAKAYAGLSETYCMLEEYSALPDADAYPRAIAAAHKAIELDDNLAEGHRALAFVEVWGEWDFTAARKEFLRAIELDPGDAQTRRWFANSFAITGHTAESLAQLDKAQELDPSSHPTMADKGLLLFNAGREKEGIELLTEVERSAPAFTSPHHYLMRINLNQKNYPEYLAEGKKTAELTKDSVMLDQVDAAKTGFAHAGGNGLLKSLYSVQRKQYADGKLLATELANTCLLLGRREEALGLLEEGFARHRLDIVDLLSNRNSLNLKDEPRYRLLVSKINVPAA